MLLLLFNRGWRIVPPQVDLQSNYSMSRLLNGGRRLQV